MTLIKIQTSTSGESPRKRKTRKKTRNQKIMYNMQILLKPSIKTTCSEWYGGVGPYFVFLCICSGHLSRHCFCQAIAVAVNRSWKICCWSESLMTHIFAAISLRFPTASCFTVQTGQRLGGIYLLLKFFRKSLTCVWVSAVLCEREQPDIGRQWENRQPTQTVPYFVKTVMDFGFFFGFWRKTKRKLTKILSALVMAAMINTYCSLFH